MSGRASAPVRAGPLTAYAGGADVRYLYLGETEVVRRVHVAVRDTAWGTVPLADARSTLRRSGQGFALAFGALSQGTGLDLELECAITGTPPGRVAYSMKCRARSASMFNRIGICVLLPSTLAGRPFAATSPDERASGRLPTMIGPQRIEGERIHALAPPFTHFEIDAGNGIDVSLDFAGDDFEIEDQRNWADASFKIYSTPLSRGIPHRLEPGEQIEQSVVIVTGASRRSIKLGMQRAPVTR